MALPARNRRLIAYVQALPSKGSTRARPAFESLRRRRCHLQHDRSRFETKTARTAKSIALRGEYENYRVAAFDSHSNIGQSSFGVRLNF